MKTGFITEEVDSFIWERASVFVKDVAETKKTIALFSVSDSGMMALGFRDSSGNFVNIYDETGEFQRGVSFHTPGSYFLGWSDDNLLIFCTRSSWILMIGEDGELLDVRRMLDNRENSIHRNANYWRVTQRDIDGITYRIRKDTGLLSFLTIRYSVAEIIFPDGTVKTVYDVSNLHFWRMHIRAICAICFVGIVAFILWKTVVNALKKELKAGQRMAFHDPRAQR
ncbi:MAG: hypothetical protein FWE68_00800 [Defluviitaleaceae bacterium]|nr:hypothetical protein [Defluviitaleaceae bacterium]